MTSRCVFKTPIALGLLSLLMDVSAALPGFFRSSWPVLTEELLSVLLQDLLGSQALVTILHHLLARG